jgi:hypothetical protein
MITTLNAERAEFAEHEISTKMHISAGFAASRLRSTKPFSSCGEAGRSADGAKAAALIVIWS